MIKVTVSPDISSRLGIELSSVSVLYNANAACLTIFGYITLKGSAATPDSSYEPDVLITFHDGKGNIIGSELSTHMIPFAVNEYSLFRVDVNTSDLRFNIEAVHEIRLCPYWH